MSPAHFFFLFAANKDGKKLKIKFLLLENRLVSKLYYHLYNRIVNRFRMNCLRRPMEGPTRNYMQSKVIYILIEPNFKKPPSALLQTTNADGREIVCMHNRSSKLNTKIEHSLVDGRSFGRSNGRTFFCR